MSAVRDELLLAHTNEAAEGRFLGNIEGDDQEKVEVWLRTQPDGAAVLELTEYGWGSGLGWYPQKTLTLDLSQAAALRGMLDRLDVSSRRPAAERDGNVIQLVFS
jgi:hypothetical protein